MYGRWRDNRISLNKNASLRRLFKDLTSGIKISKNLNITVLNDYNDLVLFIHSLCGIRAVRVAATLPKSL